MLRVVYSLIASILSRNILIRYSSGSARGHLTSEHRERINAFLPRAKNFGSVGDLTSVDILLEQVNKEAV